MTMLHGHVKQVVSRLENARNLAKHIDAEAAKRWAEEEFCRGYKDRTPWVDEAMGVYRVGYVENGRAAIQMGVGPSWADAISDSRQGNAQAVRGEWFINVNTATMRANAANGTDDPVIAVRCKAGESPCVSHRATIRDSRGEPVAYVEYKPGEPIDKGVVAYVRCLYPPQCG